MNELMLRRVISILFLMVLMLSGCSLFHGSGKPIQLYTLDYTTHLPIKSYQTSNSLMVLPTQANSEIATDKIAYVKYPHQLNYFAYNRWATQPAQMLTPLMVKSLQASNHFHAIAANPFAGMADYYLTTQVVKLQQNFTQQPSYVEVSVTATLIEVKSGKILATNNFSKNIRAPYDNPVGGVIAFNLAMAQVINEITLFCVKIIK